ncbi:glycosyltransferase [Marinoscillum furvescens]|uniref:Glycosyltransferase involved in cell wall biosynthesis n=1 Tax=Marinoscillum furvescens DSM 4134 TaxID=1122208 RepID=A0A3D9L582_MARFU|nr:glycosyltransferase [Marinoscillum furvescens]RED99554.1 glycosyltransferase involved in cell wall biosynthesis [Marinoscillum furvescens DSM 4134]
MQGSARTFLIISPEPWSHLFVSKHHYAINLAKKGYKVLFLNPPSSSGYAISKTDYENLDVLDYPGFIKGLHLFPSLIRKHQQLRVFNKLRKLAGVPIDVVWSFDNSVFFDFDALPVSVRISHIVDLNQNFQTSRAAKSADFCFGVTNEIVNVLSEFNPNTYKVTHGLNVAHVEVEVSLPGNGEIKAMYTGNLAMKHLDWEILHHAAEEHPSIDFIFVGSGKEIFDGYNATHTWKKKILDKENVYFLPPVKSEEIHSYLKKADLLLVAYQQKHHIDQTNSHKILEYLYSGNPVVATFTAEYAGKGVLNMVKMNAEWVNLLSSVSENLKIHQQVERRQERKAFALKHTYEEKLNQIEQIIFQH